MVTNIDDLISQVDDLVSLPEVFVRINSMIESGNSSAADIAQVVSQDPGLTLRVLRLANSPFYGLSKEVDSVGKAVTIIGMQRLRDLVLATAAVESFEGIPNDLVTMDDFWMHSIYCGLAAKHLGQIAKVPQADTLFVPGLLHDIGQLVLFRQLPEPSLKVLMTCLDAVDEPPISSVERAVLGFDHTMLGGRLAEHWHLPSMFVETIRWHHEPVGATEFIKEVNIIHIANSVAVLAELGTDDIEKTDAPDIEAAAWEAVGLTDEVIPAVVEACSEEFSTMRNLLFPKQKTG